MRERDREREGQATDAVISLILPRSVLHLYLCSTHVAPTPPQIHTHLSSISPDTGRLYVGPCPPVWASEIHPSDALHHPSTLIPSKCDVTAVFSAVGKVAANASAAHHRRASSCSHCLKAASLGADLAGAADQQGHTGSELISSLPDLGRRPCLPRRSSAHASTPFCVCACVCVSDLFPVPSPWRPGVLTCCVPSPGRRPEAPLRLVVPGNLSCPPTVAPKP